MKIRLYHRHYGIHSLKKEIDIKLDFSTVVDERGKDIVVYGKRIIAELPKDWLPVKPEAILCTVGDEDASTGIYDCKPFRPWEKYFDAYCVEIVRPVSEGGEG
jgi:hypothetical protein